LRALITHAATALNEMAVQVLAGVRVPTRQLLLTFG